MDPTRLYDLHANIDGQSTLNPQTSNVRDSSIIEWLKSELERRQIGAPVILEAATGDGHFCLQAAAALPAARFLGIDISAARIARARTFAQDLDLSSRIEFRSLDLDKHFDEIPGGSIDVIVAMDVLEHLFDVFGFVSHASRVLRRGGVLVLRVPNIAYLRHRIRLLFGQLPVTSAWFGPKGDLSAWRESRGWDGGHLHLFTLHTLRKLLSGEGFTILFQRDPGERLEGVRRLIPSLLLGNLCVFAERT